MVNGFITTSVEQAFLILNVTVTVPQNKATHQFRTLEVKSWPLGKQQLAETVLVGINLKDSQLS